MSISKVFHPPSHTKTAVPQSRRTAWGITAVLVLLYTINYSDKILLGLVAQPLKEEFGLTSAQIGLAGSLFFFAFAVSGFFAGAINKWMTLKWSLTFLAISWAICMLPMILAASFAVLLVSRILLGFLEGPSGASFTRQPIRGIPSRSGHCREPSSHQPTPSPRSRWHLL